MVILTVIKLPSASVTHQTRNYKFGVSEWNQEGNQCLDDFRLLMSDKTVEGGLSTSHSSLL